MVITKYTLIIRLEPVNKQFHCHAIPPRTDDSVPAGKSTLDPLTEPDEIVSLTGQERALARILTKQTGS